MGDIEGGIVQGGDVVSFRGRSFRVSTHIVAAAIFSSCEIPLSAPPSLSVVACRVIVAPSPADVASLPLCHFVAQASDVFEPQAGSKLGRRSRQRPSEE